MKKEKQHKEKNTHNVSESQARYNIDINALKLAGINALMSINNPVILEKTVKSLIETATSTRKSTMDFLKKGQTLNLTWMEKRVK